MIIVAWVISVVAAYWLGRLATPKKRDENLCVKQTGTKYREFGDNVPILCIARRHPECTAGYCAEHCTETCKGKCR